MGCFHYCLYFIKYFNIIISFFFGHMLYLIDRFKKKNKENKDNKNSNQPVKKKKSMIKIKQAPLKYNLLVDTVEVVVKFWKQWIFPPTRVHQPHPYPTVGLRLQLFFIFYNSYFCIYIYMLFQFFHKLIHSLSLSFSHTFVF